MSHNSDSLRAAGCWTWVDMGRLPKIRYSRRLSPGEVINLSVDPHIYRDNQIKPVGDYVHPNGGYVRVSVWGPKPNGEPKNSGEPDYVAEAICSPKDVFVKRIGLEIAFGRVQKQMESV